ncbi:PREDICTED: myosin-2 heavy chain-like isoform X2 [Branchiostoma belcheri]|uniref:Myosin-2 heavy chain-like isoform X2 n=1 Tax=Branchiostoma belcheri TaxID=7741 RepID=A0A6P4YWX7_BRABE|nr:PREDICTED: myosin-2 heavy chain-like isoform X2 [Branchiostoma belcheri]
MVIVVGSRPNQSAGGTLTPALRIVSSQLKDAGCAVLRRKPCLAVFVPRLLSQTLTMSEKVSYHRDATSGGKYSYSIQTTVSAVTSESRSSGATSMSVTTSDSSTESLLNAGAEGEGKVTGNGDIVTGNGTVVAAIGEGGDLTSLSVHSAGDADDKSSSYSDGSVEDGHSLNASRGRGHVRITSHTRSSSAGSFHMDSTSGGLSYHHVKGRSIRGQGTTLYVGMEAKEEMHGLNDRLASFMAKVRHLEKKNSYFEKQMIILERVQIELRESRERIDTLGKEKRALDLEHMGCKNEKTHLNHTIVMHTERIRNLEDDLREARTKIRTCEDELNSKYGQTQARDLELEGYMKRVRELEAKIALLIGEKEFIETQRLKFESTTKDLKGHIEKMRQEMERKDAVLQERDWEVKTKREEIHSAQMRIDELLEELKRLRNENLELKSSITAWERRCGEAETKADDLAKLNDGLQSKYTVLMEENKTIVSQAAAKQSKGSDLQKQLDDLMNKLHDLEARNKELSDNNGALSAKVNELGTQLKDKDMAIGQLNDKNKALIAETESLGAEIKDKESAIGQLNQRVETVSLEQTTALTQKQGEALEKAEKEARLRRELEDELARVKEHLERANKDREELEGKVKGLRNELQDKLQVKMAMEEYQAKNKDLQAEIDRLKKDLEEAKRRQTELRQKLQVTTTQLEGQGEASKELNDEKLKVQNLMAEIERMKRDLKTADALREEQEGKILALQEELDAAKDKHLEYEREIDRLKELEDELHTVKMTLEETLTIRRELEVSLEATRQEIHITKMEITQKEEAANTLKRSMAADKDRLQSDLDNMRQEGDEMRDELDKLRRELENANRLREEAEQKLADGAQELDDLKGQLETFEGNNERADELESEIDRMKRDLHLNSTLKIELEQKSSELEMRIQSLIEELDESRRKEKEAMKKYQLESNRCLELEEEVVRVKKEVRIELESRIIQLKEELENKLRCEREHQEQLDISRRDIDLELNKLRMQLQAAQKENDQMNATIQQQVTQIQAAETTKASSGQQQQDLQDELDRLRQQLNDANTAVLNLNGQLESAKDEVDGKNNDLLLKLQQMELKGDEDDKERKDLQNEIDRLKKELADANNKNMELSYQLGAAKDDLERKTQEMTTMITTMKETVIVQPQDNSDLLSALGDLKKQYADLANKKDDDKDDWYKDKFDDLTKQLQKANDALLAAKEEILNLNKQLGDSDDEVEALRKLLKELEGQLAEKEKEATTGADQAEKDLEELETKLVQAEEDAADQIMELALKNMELLNAKMDADRDNWIYKDLLADENGKLILEPISPWTFMQTVIPEIQIEEITIISEEAVEMTEIKEVKKGEEIIKIKEGEKVMVKVIEEAGEKVKITQIIDAAGALVLEIREELHMKTTEPGYLGYKMIEVEERSDVFKSTLEKFIFYLINRQDGQALGVVSGEGVTESEIAIRSKADGKEQLWSFTNGMIINRLNNLALDVPGANAKDGVKVVATQPVPGKKSQQWVLHGDGFIRTALQDSLVLDNSDGTLALKSKIPNAAEAKVQEWDLVILGDTAEFNRQLKISEEMIMEMSRS